MDPGKIKLQNTVCWWFEFLRSLNIVIKNIFHTNSFKTVTAYIIAFSKVLNHHLMVLDYSICKLIHYII